LLVDGEEQLVMDRSADHNGRVRLPAALVVAMVMLRCSLMTAATSSVVQADRVNVLVDAEPAASPSVIPFMGRGSHQARFDGESSAIAGWFCVRC
jgi:hypothetical protein